MRLQNLLELRTLQRTVPLNLIKYDDLPLSAKNNKDALS